MFELSRRNRLLHFRPTFHSLNLTQASVPLSFDIKSISPDRLLTWSGSFAAEMSAGRPVLLNQHLNLIEQPFVPGLLDQIRVEAARDAVEYGFEQLRLVLCFMRWSNVKLSPPEQYDSPFVLLPVRLTRKKGVRDSYVLQAVTTEAQINPVLRHMFKRLYDIDLPASVDISICGLDALYEDLAGRIAASDYGIQFSKVSRPRIDLIHAAARKRLDRYRHNSRKSTAQPRRLGEIDYDYNRDNFRPLGLALFRTRVRHAPLPLRDLVQQRVTPRSYAVPASDDTNEMTEKTLFALDQQAPTNPYQWEFDLCRVTLGNFRYRKMTLVRDYDELLVKRPDNPAFDAVFSELPRPAGLDVSPSLSLQDRFDIVACDPTQAAAVFHARTGSSYIIQGPPGTGKSQTITNLIADYVMRGKKVLFVCEKRAALDVVYARLRQHGLHTLCSVIHDSQADKKEFIADLKSVYEQFKESSAEAGERPADRRMALHKTIQDHLRPLEEFNAGMLASPATVGIPLWELVDKSIDLADLTTPVNPKIERQLPPYGDWIRQRQAVERLAGVIADMCGNGPLASHSISLLSPAACLRDSPADFIIARLQKLPPLVDDIISGLQGAGVTAETCPSIRDVHAMLIYAESVGPLTGASLLPLLQQQDTLLPRFRELCNGVRESRAKWEAAQLANSQWIKKLPAEEVSVALEQASGFDGRLLAPLRPAWWRLRKVLHSRYNFTAAAVRPGWTGILTALNREYQAQAELARLEGAACREFGLTDSIERIAHQLRMAESCLARLPSQILSFHRALLAGNQMRIVVEALRRLRPSETQLAALSADFIADDEDPTLEELRNKLGLMASGIGELDRWIECLRLLANMPQPLAAAFRRLPLSPPQLEAAMVRRTLAGAFLSDSRVNRFNGAARDRHAVHLQESLDLWRRINAAAVLEKSQMAFQENYRISSAPSAGLTADQKRRKAAYSRGRRELEHEFGKVIRFKSIRDLAAGDSGLVISDLKPVWLMSPLGVSDTLPLRTDQFDVVIFDEASQIPLEEAVPAVFRARQAIVVGDEMQLPPTNFFSIRPDSGEEANLPAESGDVSVDLDFDLASGSLLNHAAENLPSCMLEWHYRSHSEALISFSNRAFYAGRLLTVPDRRVTMTRLTDIPAHSPDCGTENAVPLLGRPISFHLMGNGLYTQRGNTVEADYIAQLLRGLLNLADPPSIGIIAFSEAQQKEIEQALQRLGEQDAEFGRHVDREFDRRINGQFAGLLIKNLENIQGDERDVIILSVCYGPGPDKKMRMNFGPINQSGGAKRLNVAFSRAKCHMAVVSSIRSDAITNEYNDGANCLRSYLKYAEACSAGDTSTMERVLRKLSEIGGAARTADSGPRAVVRQLAAALRRSGFSVDLGVGMSRFRCDLAVRHADKPTYRLGVLVDWHTAGGPQNILDREVIRPQLLRSFGWNVVNILAKDWLTDRSAVLAQLIAILQVPEQASAKP